MELSVRCYNGNATVFGEDGNLMVEYSRDFCEGFTYDECRDGFKEEILDFFGDVDEDSLEKVLDSIMNYASPNID